MTYFQYLRLAETRAQRQDAAELKPVMLALLQVATRHFLDGDPQTVTALIGRSGLGSPASLHAKLSELKRAGWVRYRVSAQDARVKLVEPTAKALDYFAGFGRCIVMAAQPDPEHAVPTPCTA